MHDSTITITTFGYLHDAPPPAHITLDLREHFRNPHIDPALRYLTARDIAVHTAVLDTPGIRPLLDAAEHAVLAYLDGPSAAPATAPRPWAMRWPPRSPRSTAWTSPSPTGTWTSPCPPGAPSWPTSRGRSPGKKWES